MFESTGQMWGRYHRHLDGADFSLEANTESTPEAGCFYLLRDGEVLLQSTDFAAVEAAYKALCREYWERRIGSDDRKIRVASAWGLLGLDLEHPAAAAVIRDDGTAADAKRVTAMRCKQRWEARRGARVGAPRPRR